MWERHGAVHQPPTLSKPAARNPRITAGVVLVGVTLIAIAIWLSKDSDEGATARPTTTARDAQSDRENVSEVKTVLKNGVIAMETYAVDHSGDTSGATTARLVRDGLTLPSGVALTVESTSDGYCVTASHRHLPDGHPWKTATYDSDDRAFVERDSCS
jgi:hypothetical protein